MPSPETHTCTLTGRKTEGVEVPLQRPCTSTQLAFERVLVLFASCWSLLCSAVPGGQRRQPPTNHLTAGCKPSCGASPSGCALTMSGADPFFHLARIGLDLGTWWSYRQGSHLRSAAEPERFRQGQGGGEEKCVYACRHAGQEACTTIP